MRRQSSLTKLLSGVSNRLRQTGALAAPPYAGIIAEADSCVDDADRAEGFVETGGLGRLAEAVRAAEADGRDELAATGRTALTALSTPPRRTESVENRGTDIPPDQ